MPKKLMLILIVLVAAALGAYFYLAQPEARKSYGFIDLRESALSFEISGRIVKHHADEGQRVQEGQLLSELDTTDLSHQLEIQRASCEVVQKELEKLEQGYRPELVENARAQVQVLTADLKLKEAAFARIDKLYRQKAVSAQERDDASYARDSAEAALKAQQALLEQYERGYEQADIEVKRQSLKQCRAQEQYLSYKIESQSRLYAPYSGLLRSRLQEVGAMVTPQSPVFYLSDVDEKKVRFYLSELEVQQLSPGMAVTVENTAGLRAQAVVTAVSESAMFTPKNVQTEDLRPELMYELTAKLADPEGNFRLGQAVTIIMPDAAEGTEAAQ